MNLIIIAVIFSVSGVLSEITKSKIYPYDLKVENLQNPLAVDVPNPRLHWKLNGFLVQHKVPNNLSQSAYQIVAASNPEDLFILPDLWNTGKVKSDIQTVKYQGILPAPGEIIYWTVRVWDQHDNVSDFAKYNTWGTGLNESQWAAHWISVSEDVQKQGLVNISAVDKLVTSSHAGLKPVVYLRKTFSLDADINEATVYATAKGVYNLFINDESGMTVQYDNPVLSPGWTDFTKSIQYQAYNVTRFIKTHNTIGVMLGTGWYSGYIGFQEKYGYYGNKEEFLLELHILFKNGSHKIIRSDSSWKASTGRLIYSDLLQGELQYEDRDLKDWLNFSYDDSKWSAVNTTKIDRNVSLIAERSTPTVELDNVFVQNAWESSPGVWVYDFGTNFAGYVMIQLTNFTSNVRVQVRHAEMLNPNGSIYTVNLRKARAVDTYLLNDPQTRKETIVLKPSFTYHGFRYAEVTGLPKKLDKITEITGITIGIRQIYNGIQTSSVMVNSLAKNIKTSHVANFISVPTDCPQRDERLGWMGDAQVFAHTAIYNGDIAGFYTKWLRDVREAQLPSGGYSMVAPRIIEALEGGPAWGDAGIIVPWHVYRMYGDLEIIRVNYVAMQKWIDFIWSVNPDYIWINHAVNNLGDWLNANEDTPKPVIATAFFAYDSLLLSRMAKAIGKQADSAKYGELYANISKAFVEKFVNKTDGKILGDTQTGYSLAVAFNVLPSELVPKAVDNLVANIKRHNWHLTTGFVGVGYLLPVLSEHGHDDVAYKLLLQTTYPSWGFMIENNATSIWERWDGYSQEKGFQDAKMNSFNHYALGSVGRWLYQYMAGIDTDNEQVGFKKIIIKPHIGLGINYTDAWYYTPQGVIRLHWEIIKNVLNLEVTIPVNTKATIILPFLKEKWSTDINSGKYTYNIDLN